MPIRAFKPSYKRILQAFSVNSGKRRVLDTWWRNRQLWPKGSKSYIYAGDALDIIGRTLFGSAWTGNEVDSFTCAYDFPHFTETVLDFRYALDSWKQKLSNSFDDPSLSDPSLNTNHYPSLPSAELSQWGQKYRTDYDLAAESWDKSLVENAEALARIEQVVEWISALASDGELLSFIRLVDTYNAPGSFLSAPDGFWDTENILSSRFYQGWVELSGIAGADQPNPVNATGRFYIFFDRRQLQERLRAVGGSPKLPDEYEGVFLSRYMRLALAVIQAEGITETNWGKVDGVRETARILAPQFGIDPDDKKTVIRYIGTIIRPPESEAGRAGK